MNKIFLFFILSCSNSSSNFLRPSLRNIDETISKKDELKLYFKEKEGKISLFVNKLEGAKSYSLFHSIEENLANKSLIFKLKASELIEKSIDIVFFPEIQSRINFYLVRCKLRNGKEVFSNILKISTEFIERDFYLNSSNKSFNLNFDNLSDFDSKEELPSLPPTPSKIDGHLSEDEYSSENSKESEKDDLDTLKENFKVNQNNKASLENINISNGSFEYKEINSKQNLENFSKSEKKRIKKEQKEILKEEEKLKKSIKKDERIFLKRKNSILKLIKISEKLISNLDGKEYLEEKQTFIKKLKETKDKNLEKLNEIEYLKSYKRLKILNIQIKKLLN